jgi:hypothetical protein
VVIPVVKGDSAASSRRREKPENARVVQAFSVSALRIMDSTAALPNHPRYQLRYTRIFDFHCSFLKISLSVVIPVVKGNFSVTFRQREKPANARAARASSQLPSACPHRHAPVPAIRLHPAASGQADYILAGAAGQSPYGISILTLLRVFARKIYRVTAPPARQSLVPASPMANTNQKMHITRG